MSRAQRRGDFVLGTPITYALYTYDLELNGSQWFLNGQISAMGATYLNAATMLMDGFATTSTMQQRMGRSS